MGSIIFFTCCARRHRYIVTLLISYKQTAGGAVFLWIINLLRRTAYEKDRFPVDAGSEKSNPDSAREKETTRVCCGPGLAFSLRELYVQDR